MWDENAEVWTKLSRMGVNIYHDAFIAPAFISMLPDITGLTGLDIGCGEGTDTRMLAKLGGVMTGLDVSKRFIEYAREEERRGLLGVRYKTASAWRIPFAEDSFDFATATMSLMDVPEPERAIREAFRVIKPGGFLQFSITHPCFDVPHRKWIDDPSGKHVAMAVSDYFGEMDGHVEEWIFHFTPPELKDKLRKFRIPRFSRTLSWWLNALIESGFVIEYVLEPTATDEAVRKFPHLDDTRIMAHFLMIRCRKPPIAKRLQRPMIGSKKVMERKTRRSRKS